MGERGREGGRGKGKGRRQTSRHGAERRDGLFFKKSNHYSYFELVGKSDL